MLDKTYSFLQTAESEIRSFNDSVTRPLYEEAVAEIKALRTLPLIVCLCGSSRFKEPLLAVSEAMTMQGHIVLAPNVFHREMEQHDKPGLLVSDQQKGLLDALHFRKIDLAGRVHVVNVGGYIGQSVHKEVMYAVRTDKLITFAEGKVIPWDTKHQDEVSVVHYMAGVRSRVAAER